MDASLLALALAVAGFVGGHFLLSWAPVRDRLVASVGEKAFLGLYSLVAAGFLFWMASAYSAAPRLPLWDLGAAGRHLPLVLMPPALILAVLGLIARNPTAVGGERADLSQPTGIFTVTRHPFLWGAALWAFAHLAANGDAPSLLLFGGVALLALGGMAAIDAKRARQRGEAWRAYARRTSVVPFAAAISGRTRVDWTGIGWWRPLLGLALFAALAHAHPLLFGVRALPGAGA